MLGKIRHYVFQGYGARTLLDPDVKRSFQGHFINDKDAFSCNSDQFINNALMKGSRLSGGRLKQR
jgi:hypothetical protein